MAKTDRRPLNEIEMQHAQALTRLVKSWQLERRGNKERWGVEVIADYLDISQSGFSQFMNGKVAPNLEMWKNICKFFQVHPSVIGADIARQMSDIASTVVAVSEASEPEADEDESEYFDVDYRPSAKWAAGSGYKIHSWDDAKPLSFRKDFLRKHSSNYKKYVEAIHVSGRSMIDIGIPEDAVALIEKSEMSRTPKVNKVVAIRIDDEYLVKQLVLVDGIWYARSRNEAEASKPEYRDRVLGDDAQIVGKVFWVCFEL